MTAAYFLLDATDTGFKALVEKCRAVHEANAPRTMLSVAYNVARTQALVKVAGVDKAWSVMGRVPLDSATRAEHEKFVALLAAPEWREKEQE